MLRKEVKCLKKKKNLKAKMKNFSHIQNRSDPSLRITFIYIYIVIAFVINTVFVPLFPAKHDL